jgi:hypothetical protein
MPIANFIGKSLGFLALLFVFYKISQEFTFSTFVQKFDLILSILPVLFLLNFLSTIIGIYAWHTMLKHYSAASFVFLYSYYYYAKTEISKYLPGNVFHLLGRQMIASKIGITQKQMATISLFFTLLLLVATVISATLFALFTQAVPIYFVVLMALSSLGSLLLITFIYQSFSISKKSYLVFSFTLSIALQGFILGLIVIYLSPTDVSLSLFCLVSSIYIISWLIGFVTPGASGGLGIREGTFMAITTFFKLPIDSEVIIFAILLVRLINIIGDVLIYLSTFFIKDMPHIEEATHE